MDDNQGMYNRALMEKGGTWEIWKGTLEKVDCLSKRALENAKKKKKQRAECIVVLWILWGSKSCVWLYGGFVY